MHCISVVVPVYNVEQDLDRCMKSICNQTHQDMEIILVDDGSTDSSPQRCDEWAAKDKRIQVIHKRNGGLSDARNTGINAATGNYLAFVDSDDWIDESMIEHLLLAIQQQHATISVGRVDWKNPSGKTVYCQPAPQENYLCRSDAMFELILQNAISPSVCNKLYCKDLFNEIRFPVGKLHEDQFVMYKLFDQCDRIAFTNKAVYNYFLSNTSITRSMFNEKRFDNLDACLERLEFIKVCYPQLLKAAESHLCRLACELYIEARRVGIRKSEKYQLTQKIIKKYFKRYLFTNYYPFKDKIKLLLKLPSKRITNLLIWVNLKIKEQRTDETDLSTA